MSYRNFFLHDRDTNRQYQWSAGDNIFTCALSRRLYTQNFQTVSAHVLGDFFNLGHRICSIFLDFAKFQLYSINQINKLCLLVSLHVCLFEEA